MRAVHVKDSKANRSEVNSSEFLKSEIDTFKAIETFVIHLESCNLALVRKSSLDHPESSPVKLANSVARSLALNMSISRRIVDMLVYYLKDVTDIVDAQDVNFAKRQEQNSLLGLAEYVADIESQLKRGKLSKQRALSLIDGATTILSNIGHIKPIIAKSILSKFKESNNIDDASFRNTLSKLKNSMLGSSTYS
jgi:hypothetical protein